MSSANKSFNSNRTQDSRGGGRNQSQQNGSWNMMGGGYNNSYSSNSYSQQAPPPPPPGPPPSQPNPPQPLMQQQQQQQYTQAAAAYPQTTYQGYQQQATNAVQGQVQQTAAWSYPQQRWALQSVGYSYIFIKTSTIDINTSSYFRSLAVTCSVNCSSGIFEVKIGVFRGMCCQLKEGVLKLRLYCLLCKCFHFATCFLLLILVERRYICFRGQWNSF